MQNVLITGASSGFGLNAAVTLAKHGFRVYATMRDPGKRGALDQALAAANVSATVLPLDVTDAASIAAAVAAIVTADGRIDALVNNAGFGIAGFIEDLSLEEYRRQFDTNFFGLVAVTKAVLPHMRRQRAGRIVNLSSVGGRVANILTSAYNASKFAVEGFSEALAMEASLFDVQVALIEPGAFKTEIFSNNLQVAARTRDPASPYHEVSQIAEATIQDRVVRRAGDPQIVADAILEALTARAPKLRYPVGFDARVALMVHRFGGFRAYFALVRRALSFAAFAGKLRTEA